MMQITAKGDTLHLSGEPPHAGDTAPDFTLLNGSTPVTIADLPRKPRLFSVVPAIETKTCGLQTRAFNDKLAAYGDSIAAYTISLDPPELQAHFCSTNGIENMQALSDEPARSFGDSWGLVIEESGKLARAVFVLDANDTVTYAQVVPELTEEPDYAPALAALDSLL
jgi:thioredoxin-dependent peroxiredoxin